jgi:hypothetical protein
MIDQHHKLEVFLVDRIDQASLLCLHQQLSYISGLLAASNAQSHHLVLCVLTKTGKTDGQLKVAMFLRRCNIMRFAFY